ncbi:MAG: oligopeptide/dipeptide ABC transporter ATP-binding protein, partial [bacterium]
PNTERAEFNEKVKIISHQYESDYKAIIDEFKRLRPNLQDALDQAKIKAKAEVQEYRDAAIKTHQQAITAAAQLGDPKQRKMAIHEAKSTYVRSLRITKQEAKERVIQLMKEVGIPEPEKRFYHYPFQYSGGMRQRIVIAIALATDPEVLICDEPTTALDVTIQSQILELINKIKVERKISIIFITHNLGVVANMADRIAVMYAGKIVEYGETNEIFYNPRHPYTWALLSSMPDLESRGRLDAIPGTPPNMLFPPKGDAFAPRNQYALKIDYEIEPPMFQITDTHFAATWLLHDYTPAYEAPAIVAKLKAKKEVYDHESDS